jgi:hypothetical protein
MTLRVCQFALAVCLTMPCVPIRADDARNVAVVTSHGAATNWFTFEIHPRLPFFQFHLLRETSTGQIEAIEVFTNGVLPSFQLLTNRTQQPEWEGGKGLFCRDMNFDGFGDLMALNWWGATGNVGYNCWLYDTNAGRFVFSVALSDLCRPEFNATTRSVHEYSRGGSREFSSATLVWEDGKLTMVEEVSQQAVRYPVQDWLQRVSPVRLKFLERDPDYKRITRVRTNGVWKANTKRLKLEDVL